MTYPIDAVIAVTYRCQARCQMCSIWQVKEHNDLPPEAYRKIPDTLHDVNISGGEPFLRKDLAEIVKVVHERVPRARMVVSTNALMGEAVLPRALELRDIYPAIGFGISIDGVGEMHDHVRGIPGGFEKSISVVKGLRDAGVKNLRIAYTLTADNPDHMIKVYELARQLGVQFTMQVSHESDFFFGKNDPTVVKDRHPLFGNDKMRADFERIINEKLSSFELKRWGKAFLIYGTWKLAAEGVQLFSSRPGVDYFFLDPGGDVYPSVLHNHVMGNIRDGEFDAVWRSEQADEARRRCIEENRPYWLGCMLRRALLDRKFAIGSWVIKNKLTKVRL
jgi:MoaA/NifB/PqqE/SkfB family radical SAM enzyme